MEDQIKIKDSIIEDLQFKCDKYLMVIELLNKGINNLVDKNNLQAVCNFAEADKVMNCINIKSIANEG